GDGNRTAGLVDHGDARVEARDVIDRAAGLRQDLQLAAADRGADALGVRGEQVLRGAGHDGHGAQVGDARVEDGVDVGHLVELQVDVVAGGRALACLVDGDGVRTTDAEAAGGVVAVRIGQRAAG